MKRIRRILFLTGLFVLFNSAAAIRSSTETEGTLQSKTDERRATTVEGVMRRLAQNGGVEARFHESRQIAILEDPITSTGMLYFAPPDWLARHVTAPGQSRVIVRDDRVMFRDETGVQTLELGSSEVARALVGNTMMLMRGDHEALVAQFETSLHVDGESWTLDLTPRSHVVREIISRIRVQGRGGELVLMESMEPNGDLTRTTFSEVKLGVEFSAGSRAEIFSVHPIPDRLDVSSSADSAP